MKRQRKDISPDLIQGPLRDIRMQLDKIEQEYGPNAEIEFYAKQNTQWSEDGFYEVCEVTFLPSDQVKTEPEPTISSIMENDVDIDFEWLAEITDSFIQSRGLGHAFRSHCIKKWKEELQKNKDEFGDE